MRWPLRNQILVRTLLLLVVTIVAITYANIQTTIKTNRLSEQQRMEQILSVVQVQTFPLTENVLESMRSLSGAEFVVTDQRGQVQFRTENSPETLPESTSSDAVPVLLETSGVMRSFFHAKVPRTDRVGLSGGGWLHVFVQRQTEARLWWQASRFPLIFAAIAIPLACLVSFALASQVTRPLAILERRVKTIADGDHATIDMTQRNDEIGDLSQSVNHMVTKLGEHEENLRTNERYQTLIQVGNGVAHQLRNSATGCKMALEILGDEFDAKQSEGYDVASRQLSLMDNYIRNFLQLSKQSSAEVNTSQPIADWEDLLNNVVSLLRPSAEHLGIQLVVESAVEHAEYGMSEEDAEQLMMNLISNAISAASQPADQNVTPQETPIVEVKLKLNSERLEFLVSDSGLGPPAEIADTLFQPFVTGSPEGTGLGLSLVKQIADRTGGKVSWTRSDERTRFQFVVRRDGKMTHDVASEGT